jgi:hypothetical protein
MYTSEIQLHKNMKRKILTQKWPQINEETVYRKLFSNTEILELRILSTYLYIDQNVHGNIKYKNSCRMEKMKKYCTMSW